jgi:hypothetical protein
MADRPAIIENCSGLDVSRVYVGGQLVMMSIVRAGLPAQTPKIQAWRIPTIELPISIRLTHDESDPTEEGILK